MRVLSFLEIFAVIKLFAGKSFLLAKNTKQLIWFKIQTEERYPVNMQVAQNASTVVIKRYKNSVFFQIIVGFTARCNKKTRTKKLNLGIFELIVKLDNWKTFFVKKKKQKSQKIIFKKTKKIVSEIV